VRSPHQPRSLLLETLTLSIVMSLVRLFAMCCYDLWRFNRSLGNSVDRRHRCGTLRPKRGRSMESSPIGERIRREIIGMPNVELQLSNVAGRTVTVTGSYSGLQAGDKAYGVAVKYQIAVALSGTIQNTQADQNGQILITSAMHGLISGNRVRVSGLKGTSEANGLWSIDMRSPDQFVLLHSTYVNRMDPSNQPQAIWTLLLDSTEHELLVNPNSPPPPPANWTSVFNVNQPAEYVAWARLSWSGNPNILESAKVPFSIS
jgi:hypothetical protein